MTRQYNRTNRLLTVDNLNLDFHGNKILRDINLHIDDLHRPGIHQGQVVSLLGPSGIGKTQLFKCLSGLMKPTSGAVQIGKERTPVKAGEVGFVFQNYPLLEHRTIIQNLMLAANNAGKKKDEVMSLLTEFQLADKVDMYPAQLSGGQRQRISILQQVLCSEHFILMDEPFSGLDVISKQKMMDLITKISLLHEENTIILTTHDLEAAVSISDTIWVLGHAKDEKGNYKMGATVVEQMDLIERGLAWNPNVRNHPNFHKTCEELYTKFSKIY